MFDVGITCLEWSFTSLEGGFIYFLYFRLLILDSLKAMLHSGQEIKVTNVFIEW
jgi:hypothetical protein